MLGEGALHIPAAHRSRTLDAVPQQLAAGMDASWQAVTITTAVDHVSLQGWYFSPLHPNGRAVVMLHGISDTRAGLLGAARLLLSHRYSLLLADSRGHGSSGGELVTYGVREVADVHQWVDWLVQEHHPERIYGFGESLGGAILLQSLPTEPRFRAVIAECPFADFHRVAYDRVGQRFGLPYGAARWLLWPLVEPAFGYAAFRYGIDLREASPLRAVARTTTPILLIHGTADRNIPPVHSHLIQAVRPASIALWEVPGAGHTAAQGTQPEQFAQHVLQWYAGHD